MKRNTRTILALVAAIGLTTGSAAYAMRGDGSCAGPMKGQAMEKVAGSRLEKLHADLKLAPDQESAWKAWSEPMLQRAATMNERRPDFEAMSNLPAPERMDKMLERMKTHQKEMEAGVAATKTFYAMLNPEQRQVFDRFQPFGEHRGGRGSSDAKAGRS